MKRVSALLTGLLVSVTVLVAPSARADDDHPWTSLLANTPLAGSGWSACPDPIHVSVDSSEVDPARRAGVAKAVRRALGTWNRNRVVNFAYGGEIPVRFDPATGVSQPIDGIARDRWIYLTVVTDNGKSSIDPFVVGLAGPLRVDPTTNTIIEASAAFRASYVNRVSLKKNTEVIAHELGHVMGLGHSRSRKDLMYAILDGNSALGPGDRAGGRALLQSCPAVPSDVT